MPTPSLVARAAGLLLLVLALSPPVGAQQLYLHHIDVDQGDATLLVMPNGRTLLVDSGLDSRGDEVASFLRSQNISRLDAFLLTHFDSDHMGGIDRVIAEGIGVDTWYDRGGWSGLPDAGCTSQLCQYQRVAGTATPLWPGSVIDLDSTVSISIVAANGQVRPGRALYPFPSEENALSVALVVTYRGYNYFIGGDLTAEVEERLVEQAAIGDIDVYRVSHHGSETSSSLAFMRAVRPEVAIISNGSHAGYRHPRSSVLDALRSIEGVDIYQTNRLLEATQGGGNTGNDFIADLESTDTNGTITIVVGTDGFEVIMPARGSIRQYPIERP